MISEIESSISYVNVEFVVVTALLLTNETALMKAPTAGIGLLVAFVFFLFGGLSFAVAGGEVARGPRGIAAAGAALEWGNILTEWFGLYMVLFVLPVVVQVRAGGYIAGIVAILVLGLGYASYVVSGYDLLGRFLHGRARIAGHLAFGGLTVFHWIGVSTQRDWLTYAAGVLFVLLTGSAAVVHRRRGEFE